MADTKPSWRARIAAMMANLTPEQKAILDSGDLGLTAKFLAPFRTKQGREDIQRQLDRMFGPQPPLIAPVQFVQVVGPDRPPANDEGGRLPDGQPATPARLYTDEEGGFAYQKSLGSGANFREYFAGLSPKERALSDLKIAERYSDKGYPGSISRLAHIAGELRPEPSKRKRSKPKA